MNKTVFMGWYFLHAMVILLRDAIRFIHLSADDKTLELLNPGLLPFSLPCCTGEGMNTWLVWITEAVSIYRQSISG